MGRQKALSKAQNEVLNRLEDVLKEALESGIQFVYNESQDVLIAYNGDGLDIAYCGCYKEHNGDEEFDDSLARFIDNFIVDRI